MSHSTQIPVDIRKQAEDRFWKEFDRTGNASIVAHRIALHPRFLTDLANHITQWLENDDYWYEGE